MSVSFPPPGDLLPHRPPLLLLRAVLSHRREETRCEGWFDEPFARACGGEVPAAFGLELIAQTAAVHHGLCRRTDGRAHDPAARGLLLGSRRLRFGERSLPVGKSLQVTVFDGGHEPGPGGLIRFEGRVEDASGRFLVSGDATVLEWRPDTPLA